MKFVLYFILFLLSCSSQSGQQGLARGKLYFVNPDASSSPVIELEIARTPEQRNIGLMYRRTLKEKEGMIFIFSREEERSFWMKNTYIPLDIIYLNSDMTVVSIVKNTAILSKESLPSLYPAQYVVEINSGLSDKWGVVTGSKAIFKE